MAVIDTRHLARESLLMLAELQSGELPGRQPIRVRNFSGSGLMGSGGKAVTRGTRVTVHIRGVEPIAGIIAWVQDDRFGVGFEDEVDSDRIKAVYSEFAASSAWARMIVDRPEL